jgi:hypothetical protein
MEFAAPQSRLSIIEGDSLIRGARVFVSQSSLVPPHSVGVFTAWPGTALETSLPVRVVPLPDVTGDLVVVPAGLAADLAMPASGDARWSLRTVGVPRPVSLLHIETMTDRPLPEQRGDIESSGELHGLLVRPAEQGRAETVRIGSSLYRVVRVVADGASASDILEVTKDSSVRLIAPGSRAVVDVVILADTSHSMSINDLTERAERPPPEPPPANNLAAKLSSLLGFPQPRAVAAPSRISRLDALQRAIERMIDIRTRVSGRGSRFALLRFSDSCEQAFPAGDGMIELDDRTPPETAAQFRRALGLLRPEGGTDIGSALYRAFDLLHRHYREEHERVIVLVSDGAHAPSRTVADTGREIGVTEDPAQLLARLSRILKVKMVSIGISDPTTFARWVQEAPRERATFNGAGYRPDHELLTELMQVSRSERPNPGTAEDLMDIFTGVGSGAFDTITVPPPGSLPPLSKSEHEALKFAGTSGKLNTTDRERIASLLKRFSDAYDAVRQASLNWLGAEPFRTDSALAWATRGQEPATSQESFRNSMGLLFGFLHEGRTKSIQVRSTAGQRTVEVEAPWNRCRRAAELLADTRIRDVVVTPRNFLSHHQGESSETRFHFQQLLQRAVNVPHIEPHDGSRWIQLQAHVLETVANVLEEAHREMMSEMLREQTKRQPAPAISLPPQFSW